MKQTKKGFTLVELLVVISIIVIMAAMAAPALSDVMSKRHLNGAATAIQMACMETRSRAIAQRERQVLAFALFRNNNSDNIINDEVTLNKITISTVTMSPAPKVRRNTISSYDSNETATTPAFIPAGQPTEISEHVKWQTPDVNAFYLIFNPDGTIMFTDITNQNNDPNDLNNPHCDDTDIILVQNNLTERCFIDINHNTGKVRTAIREPRQ